MADPALVEESRCLDERVIWDLVAGNLAGPGLDTAERHLARCDDCCALVARLTPGSRPDTSLPTLLGHKDLLRARPVEGAAAAPGEDPDREDEARDSGGGPGTGARSGAETPSPRTAGQAPSLLPGTILRDTYRILRHIERGGMGEVYEASHARLSGRYAVKVLPPEFAARKTMLSRFRREAQIASGLQHPNIVQVIDFHETDEGHPYLVMEYLEGENLGRLMARQGRFTLREALPIIQQIASALDAVHSKGVVHRDIKPQNVFTVPQPDGTRLVKLLDFGISKAKAASSVVTRQMALMGTPQYMAPEQASYRPDDVGPATDQFALAAIVYEMLTGRPAFEGPDVSVVLYQIVHEPPAPMAGPQGGRDFDQIEPVLRRALSKRIADRFSSLSEFATALANSAAVTPPTTKEHQGRPTEPGAAGGIPAGFDSASGPARRHRTAALAVLITAVAAAIAILVGIRLRDSRALVTTARSGEWATGVESGPAPVSPQLAPPSILVPQHAPAPEDRGGRPPVLPPMAETPATSSAAPPPGTSPSGSSAGGARRHLQRYSRPVSPSREPRLTDGTRAGGHPLDRVPDRSEGRPGQTTESPRPAAVEPGPLPLGVPAAPSAPRPPTGRLVEEL